MEYGTRIAQLRTEQNMSQEELASRLFVSRDLISKWENNKRRPDNEALKEICRIFSVEIGYFESFEEALIRELSKCVPKDTDISPDEIPDLLNGFLMILSERERSVFVRRYYFMETPAQIGEKYIMSKTSVWAMLSRTRKKFGRFLMERKC